MVPLWPGTFGCPQHPGDQKPAPIGESDDEGSALSLHDQALAAFDDGIAPAAPAAGEDGSVAVVGGERLPGLSPRTRPHRRRSPLRRSYSYSQSNTQRVTPLPGTPPTHAEGGNATAPRALLNELRLLPLGPGRLRSRPDAMGVDKAYSVRGRRAHLRSRWITTVIPGRPGQIGHRKNKGSAGGRPVGRRRPRLQEPWGRRTRPQPPQELARPGHPLRQTRSCLPRRRRPRIDPALAVRPSVTRARFALSVGERDFSRRLR